MRDSTKRLLESSLLEDFLIGLNYLYVKEGIEAISKYDKGAKYVSLEEHGPWDFKLNLGDRVGPSGLAARIIVENYHIILSNTCWLITTLAKRLEYWKEKDQVMRDVIHEINPKYIWTI